MTADGPRTSPPDDDAWALADGLVLAAVEAQILGEVSHPVRIGSYEVERPLGAGAMGRVLLARDPKLQRPVALKLISPHLADIPSARTRIVAEARAMAKLSDPHVAQVYEVGEDGPHLFVAMEYVDGDDLRAWLAADDRPWRRVVDVFIQAGEGLAAAHAKGLVHRDFKPENVVLEQDGRARVVDFGLARGASEDRLELETRPEDAPATLTSTGAWLGTPAYMAPEQWDGEDIDARADQFAFCVALYEALAGRRPFEGETAAEVRAALDRGVVPPIGRPIPRRIDAALRRGLATDPAQRFAKMEDLLRVLAPPSRVWILGAASATALAAAAALAMTRGDRCQDAGAPIDEIDAAGTAEPTTAAIEALDVPWATATAAAVTERYAATADAWRQAARAVCASEDAPVAATRCLGHARRELARAIARARSGDPAAVVAAVSHAELLPDPRACLQASDAAWDRDPPADETPAERAWADAARHLGELSTAGGATHYVDSLQLGRAAAGEAVALARAEGPRAQLARAAWLAGRFALRDGDRDRAERAFREAAEVAAETGEAAMRAAATIELVYVVGNDRDRTEEAQTLATDAAAMLGALGDPPVWSARLDAHEASMLAHARTPRADRAVELHERASARLSSVLSDAHPDAIAEQLNLGAALNYAERPADAERVLTGALARAEEVWGAAHPRTARIEGTLGLSRLRQGDLEGARVHLQRSLDVRAAALGEDHAEVASARFNLATVLRDQGEHAPALVQLRRGLATRERDRGPDDPEHVAWLLPIGRSELALGHPAEARTALSRAVDLLELEGAPPTRFASVRFDLAKAWLDTDPARARILAESARRAWEGDPRRVAIVDDFLAGLPAK